MQNYFNYNNLVYLKKNHPTWRLLTIENSSLVLSFLHQVFIAGNLRVISYSVLVTQLDDYLFFLRTNYADDLYPRKAAEYLDEWAKPENAFLRIYYTKNSDDPEVDLTPATEKAFEWIANLQQRQFIGTESRLLQLFEMIADIINKTETDPEMRLAELLSQQQKLKLEIAKLESGIIETYESRQVKERIIQIEEMAQSLIGDFRQIEHNFRVLDFEMRKKIALSRKHKGELLDEIFQEQDLLENSDQGKSFKSFWEYLISIDRQDQLKTMLNKILILPEVTPNTILNGIDVHLTEAGAKVYNTYNLIAEQLSKYLDNQVYLENKRINELIQSIEKKIIANKGEWWNRNLISYINDFKPSFELNMSRQLFNVPKNPLIDSGNISYGNPDFSLEKLFQQYFIDELKLHSQVKQLLEKSAQVSLEEVIQHYPLEHGLAEIITYLHIAAKYESSIIDSSLSSEIAWKSENNVTKHLKLPKIIFLR